MHGTYNGDAPLAPGTVYAFSGSAAPSGNPFLAFVTVGHFNSFPVTIQATCTLRHLTVKGLWISRKVTANWDGT